MEKPLVLSYQPAFGNDSFVGREADISWTLDMLNRQTPENCNLVGEPGVGKTSLLYQVYLRGKDIVDQTLFVWVRLSELAMPLNSPADFWIFLLHKLQVAITESISQSELNLGTLEPQDDERVAFEMFGDAISRFCFQVTKKRIALLIDNAEYFVMDNTISRNVLDWLRALLIRYSSCLAVVMTSTDSIHTLYESRFTGSVSPLARIMHTRYLGLLSEEDAKALIANLAQAEGNTPLINDDIEFLLREAGRYPDFLKSGLKYIVYYIQEKQTQDQQSTYENIQIDFRDDDHVKYLLRKIVRRRSEEEIAILSSVAISGVTVGDKLMLRDLKKLGLIEERQHRPALFSDALKYWLLRPGWLDEVKPLTIQTHPTQATYQSNEGIFEYLEEREVVRIGDKVVSLTPLENRLMQFFWKHPDQVLETDKLLGSVWRSSTSKAVVEKTVNRLRAKVEVEPDRPERIITAKGKGYIFVLQR